MNPFVVGKTYLGVADGKVFNNITFKVIKISEKKITFKVNGKWADSTRTFQSTVPIIERKEFHWKQKAEVKRIGLLVDSDLEAVF